MSKADLANAGFVPITRSRRRMISIIQSVTNAGKTRLALTGRKPVGYIAVEQGGTEGVVDQFMPKGVDTFDGIQIMHVVMNDPVYPDPKGMSKDAYQAAITEAVAAEASTALDKFYSAYYTSLANMATTVVDTGDDIWEIMRLANFGRLEKVPQLAYTQINKAMDKLIEDSFSYPGSVFWLHHMKDAGITYINDKGKEAWRPGGAYVMSGYKGAIDKVQTIIELWREDLQEVNPDTGRMIKFGAQITKSRHSADAIGRQFFDDAISIADIGAAAVNGSKPEDWV